jgi:DNA-binding transcriptional LysR family regulator
MPAPHRELDFRKLLQDELLVVCPADHAFAAKRRITWSDIGMEPLVLMPKGSSTREFVERGFAVSHVAREADYEVVNMVTSLSMVRAGLAITVMSRMALSELNSAGLSVSRIAEPRPVRDIGIIVRHDRTLSTAAQTYVDLLFAAAANDGSGAREGKPARQPRHRAPLVVTRGKKRERVLRNEPR